MDWFGWSETASLTCLVSWVEVWVQPDYPEEWLNSMPTWWGLRVAKIPESASQKISRQKLRDLFRPSLEVHAVSSDRLCRPEQTQVLPEPRRGDTDPNSSWDGRNRIWRHVLKPPWWFYKEQITFFQCVNILNPSRRPPTQRPIPLWCRA